MADLGLGPFYVVAMKLGWGAGRVAAATHEVGNAFHWSAGVMNMLLMLDAGDIAIGRKSRHARPSRDAQSGGEQSGGAPSEKTKA